MMSEAFELALEEGKRNQAGELVFAFLQQPDEDAWDSLLVGMDGQPLTFWDKSVGMEGEVSREDGSVLTVVVSTPPGVRPVGWQGVPAHSSGSPLGRLVAIVGPDGITEVEPPRGQNPPKPPPPMGRDLIKTPLGQFAMRDDEGHYRAVEVDTTDGGRATILVDWDGRVMMLWTEVDPEEGRRLMVVTVLPDDTGLVCQTIDSELRPGKSGDSLVELLAG
jgi:hypothetical protein